MDFVMAPARDELFVARRGDDATLNGRPIFVSSITRLDEGIRRPRLLTSTPGAARPAALVEDTGERRLLALSDAIASGAVEGRLRMEHRRSMPRGGRVDDARVVD
jgi:fructose-1,6-bisphosphatase/inositol monophosphatase family enzyme